MAKRLFHWSSVLDCVMHETDGDGNTLVTYTREPVQYGPLISEHRDGREYVHHYDALGSTTMLTDETGSVTDTFTYDAWGNEVARTGTTDTPYRWVGRWGYQYDEPTGSYYVRARVYQPMISRWTSIDPLEVSFGVEPFIYCRVNPVNMFDPSGQVVRLLNFDPYGAGPQPNGEYGLSWKFYLNRRYPFDVAIIQKITYRETVYFCGGRQCCNTRRGPLGVALLTNCTRTYYELVGFVQAGDRFVRSGYYGGNTGLIVQLLLMPSPQIPRDVSGIPIADDTWDRPPSEYDSCGEARLLGVARAFRITVPLLTDLRGWTPTSEVPPGSVCNITSGTFVASETEPMFWSGGFLEDEDTRTSTYPLVFPVTSGNHLEILATWDCPPALTHISAPRPPVIGPGVV